MGTTCSPTSKPMGAPDPVAVILGERSLVISSKCNQLINKCDTRFLDRFSNVDRTAKSCQCVQEKICSIIGMHHYAGCRSYSTLSVAGQRLIRLWSIDSKDRRYRFTNEVGKRFSDKQRHQQLMNGNSRFCCRSITPKKARSLRLRIRAGSADAGLLPMFSLLITYLVLR
nr:Hypothetical protein CBG16564 [Haemonchus contortus]